MVFESGQQKFDAKKEQSAQSDTALNVDVINDLDLKFKLPFRCIVQGSTCTGKSTLILNALKQFDRFFPEKFDYVAYFYPVNGLTESRQKYVEELRDVLDYLEIQEGLPRIEDVLRCRGNKLLIVGSFKNKI